MYITTLFEFVPFADLLISHKTLHNTHILIYIIVGMEIYFCVYTQTQTPCTAELSPSSLLASYSLLNTLPTYHLNKNEALISTLPNTRTTRRKSNSLWSCLFTRHQFLNSSSVGLCTFEERDLSRRLHVCA